MDCTMAEPASHPRRSRRHVIVKFDYRDLIIDGGGSALHESEGHSV